MTDAYLEFINENSYRRYPLVEDCSAVSNSGVKIPNDLIVDLRIVSRRNVPGFYIQRYDHAGQTLWIYSLDNQVQIPVSLSSVSGSDLPARISGHSQDTDYPDHAEVKAVITFGQGVINFMAANTSNVVFLPTQAPIENSCVIDISGSIVNLLGAIRQAPNQSFLVSGDVAFNGGYNTRATQSGNDVILFSDPSGGQLGKYRGQEGQSPCSGIVFSINGVRPDSLGKFSFIAGTGISITQSQLDHSITISVNTSDMGTAQCSS
jgi:hypothetical protein